MELANYAKDFGSKHSKTVAGVSLASFRGLLQAAVNISPIILASTSVLIKQSWNKRLLLDIAFHLGNDKPPELLEVEKVMLNVILSMANGTLHPNNALKRLNDDMPWDLVDSVAHMEDKRSWFDLSEFSIVFLHFHSS